MEQTAAIVPANGLPVARKRGRPPGPSKRGLRKLAEQTLVESAPALIKAAFEALERGAKANEKWAVEQILQSYGFTKAPGGVNIVQAMQVNNNGRGQDSGARSFESIIRKLETEAEVSGPLAQPDDDDDGEDDDIIDVEPEAAT